MRRRSRMKTLKILRLFAQDRIVVFIMLSFCSYILGEPGYLDFDNLPDTNFTCAGKVIGGYYADLETSCQMFHVCTIGQLEEPMDIKFLCLNGTVFDQETRVCERVDEVDCTKSERFYYLNLELYGNTMVPIPEEESSTQSTSTTSTTTTTTTTTRKPTTAQTTTTQPTTSASPKKPIAISSTTFLTPSHYVTTSTTAKSYVDDLSEDEEYEYDDDYLTTDGKDIQNYQDPDPQHVFSPQQFIYRQKTGKSQLDSPKPAISFQQQQFQNGGSLTVTNSHITVTTHTSAAQEAAAAAAASSGNNNNLNHLNKQFSNKPINDKIGYSSSSISSSSTTQKPLYSFYNAPTSQIQLPKRIPLLTTNQQRPTSGHPVLPQIPTYRIQAQGFRPPNKQKSIPIQSQHLQQQQQQQPEQPQPSPSPSPFEGYRRQLPQIPLNLPIDNIHQNHKEILGFDDTDNNYPQDEHKDLKRSDTHATSEASINKNDTNPSSNRPPRNDSQKNNNRQQEISSKQTVSSSSTVELSTQQSNNYDKVLLTLQDQYIPTLPKVIVTASASVSDASGKKLNYSVGNVIGSNAKLPPISYDEYKEDDVILDPFFLDVPKIKPGRRVRRNTVKKITEKKFVNLSNRISS